MPILNWSDETTLPTDSSARFRTVDAPFDPVGAPSNGRELVVSKLSGGDGRRMLDIVGLDESSGRPVHFVLDRDGIERLRKFLGG